MSAIPPLAAWLVRAAPRLGARALGAFALYGAVLDLSRGTGLVGAVSSPSGLALLVLAGVALTIGGIGIAVAGWRGDRGVALARAAVATGAGLAAAFIPASLVLRDVRTLVVVEGERLPSSALPGVPGIQLGAATLRPHGAHVLSKTVELDATVGDATTAIGLFPPARVGPWSVSVYRFGYAPAIRWTAPDGRTRPDARLRADGHVPLGTISHDEEETSLVAWTPEPNVMMGAGTFPPKLEELVPVAGGGHVFLRLVSATIAGQRRDLRDPDAYRWLADGPLEAPELEVTILRGRERVFAGQLAAGGRVETPAGVLELAPRVPVFVELLATRDPFLPWAGVGLALLAIGLCVRVAVAVARLAGRARAGARTAASGPPRAG